MTPLELMLNVVPARPASELLFTTAWSGGLTPDDLLELGSKLRIVWRGIPQNGRFMDIHDCPLCSIAPERIARCVQDVEGGQSETLTCLARCLCYFWFADACV